MEGNRGRGGLAGGVVFMAAGRREVDGEARAAGGHILDADLPAVGFDQRAGDGQPQPRRAVVDARLVAAIEALEDVGQIGRRDAGAVIGYRQDDARPGHGRGQLNVTAVGRVAQRIADQVADHLTEPVGVDGDGRRLSLIHI